MHEAVKHKGLALAVLAAAQFMVVLDVTIVNIALPAIRQALGFTTDAQLQWIVAAYTLAFGGFLLLGGRLADFFGRRKLFMIGAGLFAVASLLAGLAHTSAQLIAFRAVQGVGGALLAPAALSLVLTMFSDGHERNKALAVWSMVAAGGSAMGMVLGGLLTQYAGWRWIFFINLPVAALVLYAALQYLPAGKPEQKPSIDIIGALTITGGLMSFVYALTLAASNGWSYNGTLLWLGVAAALVTAFIVNERRVPQPLVPLGIFKRRNVTGGGLIILLVPASMFGLYFFLSIYLQQVLHYSPTLAGIVSLPFTVIVMLVAKTLGKRLATLNRKAILIAGPLLGAAGFLYFARLPLVANYWIDIFPAIVLTAIGMAMVFVTATSVATSGVEHHESGLVSGLLATSQQIGGAIGLAVLTVISTAATKGQLLAAGGSQAAVPAAMVYGFQRGFLVAVAIAALASLVALVVLKLDQPPAIPTRT